MTYSGPMDAVLAERDKLRADLAEAMRQRAHWMEEARNYCKNNEDARAEVERLRADANARAVEELRMQAEGCDKAAANWARELKVATDAGHRDRLESRINQLEGVAHHIRARIAELSKPAAKESEPSPQEKQRRSFAFGNTSIENPRITPEMVDAEAEKLAKESEPVQANTFNVYGVTFTADPKAPRSAVQQALAWIGHAFTSVTTMVETKPEEPDWTVTLAAQAKNSYARTDEPVEESTARLLAMVVEGLCHLGREVRRGGAK